MANIKVLGDAVVLTSDLKIEDIEMVQKLRPQETSLWEEKDGKQVPVFRISVSEDDGKVHPGDISAYGITFRKASREGGFAQITFAVPRGEGSLKELVADAFGGPLMNLLQLEEKMRDVIRDIAELKQAALDMIEVI